MDDSNCRPSKPERRSGQVAGLAPFDQLETLSETGWLSGQQGRRTSAITPPLATGFEPVTSAVGDKRNSICPLMLWAASAKKPWFGRISRAEPVRRISGRSAPVAQLDRALPSEGRGHRFESCRVRHLSSKRLKVHKF